MNDWEIERDENGEPARILIHPVPILPPPMGEVFPVRKITRAEAEKEWPKPEQLELPDNGP
jgi:hypothetical protein